MSQIDHQFFLLSQKRKSVWYCLISQNSCWEITSFHSQVRAQLWILWAPVNIALISSGTVGRNFFSCHQIGCNKVCLGAFSQALCRAFGKTLLLQHDRWQNRATRYVLQRSAPPGRQECTVTTERCVHWNDDEWGMRLLNNLGSKWMMPFLQDT